MEAIRIELESDVLAGNGDLGRFARWQAATAFADYQGWLERICLELSPVSSATRVRCRLRADLEDQHRIVAEVVEADGFEAVCRAIERAGSILKRRSRQRRAGSAGLLAVEHHLAHDNSQSHAA